MQTVEISIGVDGKEQRRETVPCKFVGKFFAVHRQLFSIFDDPRAWQVTHRPTGFKAGKNFKTRRAAIERAEWLEKRGKRAGVNWSLSDVKKMSRGEPWKELSAALQKRLQKAKS